MGKFGTIKCETCGQIVNKRKIKLHKCEKDDPKRPEKCTICQKEVRRSNYQRHYLSCRSREFWEFHGSFLMFFSRTVRYFNRDLKARSFQGCLEAKKRWIKDETGLEKNEIDVRKHQGFLFEKQKKEEEQRLNDAKKVAEEEDLNFETMENKEALKDCLNFVSPRLSCRQIIFDFLDDIKINDEKIKNKIDKKFFKKDYPTDEELGENEYLFNKIKKLRLKYDYKTYYEKFFYILKAYYANRKKFKCCACGKFFWGMKEHLKNCKSFKEKFEEKKEECITFYLYAFYKAYLWENDKLNYYINYYKQYPFNYFKSTIGKHVENKIKFIEKIEEGKRKLKLMINPPQKITFESILKEVNEWKTEEEPEEKSDEEKNEEKSELEEEESKFLGHLDEELLVEAEENEKELDEEKIKKNFGYLLGEKFIAKQEKQEEDYESSEESDDMEKLIKGNILK